MSGWLKAEFTALGEPWLEHDERYRRTDEFIRVLREIWTSDAPCGANSRATSTGSTTST